jgi:hypothetical protein
MAPGEDIQTAELLKVGGRMMWRKVPYSLLKERKWEEEQVPEEWSNAIIYTRVAR